MLKLDETLKKDESISNYETYGFYPITGTQLDNPGSITITVQNSDCFYRPARSWLHFEGQIVSTGEAYTDKSLITLANNGIMHLFDNIKYLLSSTEIESVFNPGQASTIMGLAKYSSSYKGLKQCWVPDSSDKADDTNTGFMERRRMIFTSKPTPLGAFTFSIPLDHIFGFAEDYTKVIYGFQHTLVLTRSSSDDNALFRKTDTKSGDVPNGKVTLKSVKWMLPRCTPSDVARYELYKQIKSEIVLDVGFRMRQCITTSLSNSNHFTWRLGVRSSPEQPRYVFLAFQTDREENQEKNIAAFDNCGISSAHILLNGDRYPINDFPIDFAQNQYDTIYEDFYGFMEKFYHVDKIIANTGVDTYQYKTIYPIIMFDVKNQSERLKSGITDITVHCTFKTTPTAPTVCHAVMISDRQIRFKSDGNKMVVLY